MNESSTRMRALKAMVWKEWRERFLWDFAVILMMALVLGAVIYSDYAGNARGDKDFRGLWEWTQTFMGCVVPLFAFALGWSQMSGEGKRDGWAFLVHRPATKSFLFWSKALSGLSLCALVIFVVYDGFAIGMRFVNAPMPWSWHLLLFGFSILVLCAATYFTGALLVLRDRPWIGSRLLPFCAALFVIVTALTLTLQTRSSWTVIGFLFLTIAIMALAAQSCFENETFRRRSRVAQVAMTSVLAAGLGTLFFVAVLLVTGVEASLQQRTTSQASENGAMYCVVPDGRILRYQTHFANISGDLSGTLSEPNGKIVARGKQLQEKAFLTSFFTGLNFWDFESQKIPGVYGDTYRPLGTSGVRNSDQITVWWFDCAQRRIVGYDFKSGNINGYIGTNGFSQNAENITPFDEIPKSTRPQDGTASNLLVFSHAIYRPDLDAGNVQLLLRSREEIRGIAEINLSAKAVTIRTNTPVVITKNTLTILESEPSSTRSPLVIPIPDMPLRVISVAQLPDGRFWLSFESANDTNAPVTVLVLSPDGKIQKTMTLPPLPTLTQNQMPVTTRVAIALIPAALSHWNVSEVRSFMGLPIDSREAREGVWISILLSAVAALLTSRRASRYAFKSSTRLAWIIGVFALGPLAYLLMRSLLDWSALEKCPSCGKLRVIDRELCEHCGKAFAPPLPDGTEIIENEAPQMPALRLAS